MSNLHGQVALVTGGARGLGRAAAIELARRGARVAIADRKLDLAEETAAQCGRATPGAHAFEYDQADGASVENMVAAVRDHFGRIDLLFANAGAGKFSPLMEMSSQAWDLTVRINLTGTFQVCQSVARCMIEQGQGGRVVLTASSGARVMANQLGAYCAAKAGVVMLTKHFASELGNYRIGVNAICPGVIETGMTSQMLDRPEWRRMLVRQTPVGRWGTPQEVAHLVVFLLSKEAQYINGEDIMIDGGSTLTGAPRWYSLDYEAEQFCDWQTPFGQYPYA